MYADDSTLCTADESVESINNALTAQSKAIYHWINANRMVLNVDQTECVLLSTCQKLRDALKNFSVGEDEYIVTPVSSHKLLGIHVDNTFSWKIHITHLCSKLRSRLYLFNQVKHLMPLSIRKQYFTGLVHPVMDYGCHMGKLQHGSTY